MYERAVYELEGKGTVYQKVKEKLSRILFPVLPTHTLLLAAILEICKKLPCEKFSKSFHFVMKTGEGHVSTLSYTIVECLLCTCI